MGKKTGPMPEHRKEHLRKVQQAKKEGKPKPAPTWKTYLVEDKVTMPFHPDRLFAYTMEDAFR